MAKNFTPPTAQERSTARAAEAAGVLDRVLEVGWAGLSAKESGRIGGLMSGKMRKKRST